MTGLQCESLAEQRLTNQLTPNTCRLGAESGVGGVARYD